MDTHRKPHLRRLDPPEMRGSAVMLSLGLLILCLAAGGAEAEEIQWATTSGGSWNTATNWNPQNVPNQAGEAALIPADGFTYTVTLNTSPSIDSLRIANPNATVSFGSGQTLTLLTGTGTDNSGVLGALTASGILNGNVHNRPGAWIKTHNNQDLTLGVSDLFNEGTLSVNDNVGTNVSTMTFSTNSLLHGVGDLILRTAGALNDANLATSAGVILTQASDHTIHGAGTISAALANSGLVMADETGHVLLLTTGVKSNDGTLSAAPGCYLDITTCDVTQALGGRILADGGLVRLNEGAHVIGGELASSGGSYLTCQASTPVLEDLLLTGELRVLTGRVLSLQGTEITNDGLLALNVELGSSNAVVRADDDLALTGTGTLRLYQAGDPNDASLQTATGITLTNGAGHAIAGSGLISARLINEGTVRADDVSYILQLSGDPKTNRSLIEASEDATLRLSAFTLEQDPGAVLRTDGGTVQLYDGAFVTGGLLTTAGDGVIAASNGICYLADCEIDGAFRINDGMACALQGSQVTNDGTITVHPTAATSNSFLRIDENLTVQGTGEVVMNAPTSTNDAEITGSGVLTLSADQTIRGSGEIHAAVENHGLIQADDPARPLMLQTANKINHAVLGAANGASLTISQIRVDQSAGGILAPSDGLVTLTNSATVAGGTLAPTGSAAVRVSGGAAYLDGAINAGRLEIRGGDLLDVLGAEFVNNGTVFIDYPANNLNALLRFPADASLTGSGEIVLQTFDNVNDATLGTGATSTLTIAAGQTVRGEGTIAARLDNEGLIVADVADHRLDLDVYPKTNANVMRAQDRGVLRFAGSTTTNTGTVAAVDSGVVRVAAGALVNEGLVHAAGGGCLSLIGGTLTNNGLIRIDANGRAEQTDGVFTNAGTLRAQPSGDIFIDYGTFTNAGTVEAMAGGSFWSDRLAGNYSGGRLSLGTWIVRGDGEMRLIGANVTTLNAGVVLDGPQATIYRDNATADALANLATVEWGGRLELMNGRNLTTPGALANQRGAVVVGAGCVLSPGGAYTQTGTSPTSPQQAGEGRSIVDGTFVPATGTTFTLLGGTLSGNGTITGNVFSADRVDPGASVGMLTIDGDYTQTADGSLYVEIGGSAVGQYDHLAVTGHAILDGRVWVRAEEGVTLQEGDVLTVMSFASCSGTFQERWGCAGVGLVYEVVVNPTNVQLVIHVDLSSVEEGSDPGSSADPTQPGSSTDPADPEVGSGDEQGGPQAEVVGAVPQEMRFSASPARHGQATFHLDVPEAAVIRLDVFDFNGRCLHTWSGTRAAGFHMYTWGGSRAPTGVYFGRATIRTEADTHVATARVLIVR